MLLPVAVDVTGPARRALSLPGAAARALGLPGSGSRRAVRTRAGRAYLPVRGIHEPGREPMTESLEDSLESLEGVRWAAACPALGQVAVDFDEQLVSVQDLTAAIDKVEQVEGRPGDGYPAGVPAHPADLAPIQRRLLELGVDAAGMGAGVAARLLRLPRLPVELATLVPAVDSLDPVRHVLDARPGMDGLSVGLNALLQGLGQGPLGLIVDATHRVALLAELTARRRAWLSAEFQLHPAVPPAGYPAVPPAGSPAGQAPVAARPDSGRPGPAPPGLADRYGHAALVSSLGAAGFTLALTRDTRRAVDILLAGMPRASRSGMDSFAAQLTRVLAARGVVPMDTGVLRHLDRIDTLLIDDRALATPGAERAWAAVAAAARKSGCRVIVAGAAREPVRALGAEAAVPGGERLAASLRSLQEEGRAVAVLSDRDGGVLGAADCGIGVLGGARAHPPWGAHLICTDPAAASSVMDAIRYARSASRQAVGCAAAGSAVAGLIVIGGPGSSRRAVTVVQLSALAAMAAGTWTAAQLPRPAPVAEEEPVDWHSLAAGEALARLGSAESGLPAREAEARWSPPARSERPGPLGLVRAEPNPLTLILGAGATLSAATGSLVDAALIAGVLAVNGVIGAAERYQTESTIERLSSALSASGARVLRDGTETTTDPDSLVAGDVIRIAAGDAVPADARVIESVGMEADESALTGESFPVAKGPDPVPAGAPVAERRSMIYTGTAVAAGRGSAVVVATGADTEARRGEGARAVAPTGVQSRLQALTDLTVPIVLASGAGLTLNSLLRRRPVQEAVTSGVSLAAAAVPEGLPFVATVAQASTAHRLAGRGVLVRHPGVLEALGRVDVLCFDKTGTLTEGRLSLARVSDGRSEQSVDSLSDAGRRILAAALRAAPRPRGRAMAHPTDQAIVDGAAAIGLLHSFNAPHWQKLASLPFEPGRAYHAVLGRSRPGPMVSVKGAPEVVLPRCATYRSPAGDPLPLDGAAVAEMEAAAERLAGRGLRVLAVAERAASDRADLDDERIEGLELLGFVGVADSARPTAAAPLATLAQAGIRCVMVTGDHPSTARAIATELGLVASRRVMSGPELDSLDDRELARVIDDIAVFARVTPAHKVRIVSAFQRAGRVVAMTGDGANDAQAIRMAQIGVAFGPKATSAARDAADLVVASGDLSLLLDSMIEGRAMWASVRDALALLLGGNLGEVAFTTGAALITGRPPLTPRQLIAVNLFTDLVPAMALTMSPTRSGRVELAREGPETSLAGQLARDVTIRASATAAGTFAGWLAGRLTGTPDRARTIALATLVGTQLGQTLVVGRRSPLAVAGGLVSTLGLVAVIQTPEVSRMFDCRPLGPVGWATVATASGLATAGAMVAGAFNGAPDGPGAPVGPGASTGGPSRSRGGAGRPAAGGRSLADANGGTAVRQDGRRPVQLDR